MLTIEDILTSSGKYPEREKSPECNDSVRANAAILVERVNGLLLHLMRSPKVSSGFRTSVANSAAGGAKRSAHMRGEAVDLVDPDGSLNAKIDDDILEKFDLYREDPAKTLTWAHIQINRPASGNRTFKV